MEIVKQETPAGEEIAKATGPIDVARLRARPAAVEAEQHRLQEEIDRLVEARDKADSRRGLLADLIRFAEMYAAGEGEGKDKIPF